MCRLADLVATGAKGTNVMVAGQRREVVVVQVDADAIRAYVNRCPHRFLPLETQPDRFLDAERRHLVCTMHGARFRGEDGVCVWGPCRGARLEPMVVRIEGDLVCLAAVRPN